MRTDYYLYAVAFMAMALLGCDQMEQSETANTEEVDCQKVEFLVSPTQLHAYLEEGIAFSLIEVSPVDQFQQGHIPGAQSLWRPHYTDGSYPYGGMRTSRDQLERLMIKCGVNEGNRLVLYDRKGNVDAARLRWLLEISGKKDVYLLDGGIHSWMGEGYPVASKRKLTSPGDFTFTEASSTSTQLGWQDVKEVLDDASYVLLDARTAEEYLGQTQKKGAMRAGRIPGSIHFNWMETVNPDQDFVFRNCQEIDSMLVERGITSSRKIITYCHTGVRSAHMAFVLKEIMGYSQVWNYDGSWTEWSYFDHLPIESGKISL